MQFISKAQEISRIKEQLAQNEIDQRTYNERLSSILYANYRPIENGISENEEKRLLWVLAVNDVISQRDYDEQVSKLRDCVVYRYIDRPRTPPRLQRKKGYVAPIVWLFIGLVFCHWCFPLGLLILIFSLVGLSCRVSHNKQVEVENAQIMMHYGVR